MATIRANLHWHNLAAKWQCNWLCLGLNGHSSTHCACLERLLLNTLLCLLHAPASSGKQAAHIACVPFCTWRLMPKF
jgi:hypothetical protein